MADGDKFIGAKAEFSIFYSSSFEFSSVVGSWTYCILNGGDSRLHRFVSTYFIFIILFFFINFVLPCSSALWNWLAKLEISVADFILDSKISHLRNFFSQNIMHDCFKPYLKCLVTILFIKDSRGVHLCRNGSLLIALKKRYKNHLLKCQS